MKKILIILGILVALGLGGVWVYLMFFNTSLAPGVEVFNDFSESVGGAANSDVSQFSGEPREEEEVSLDAAQHIVQLTNRPVAGAVLIGNASSTERVRFMERGTGHTYEVSLESGKARRVSGTTIPRSVEAVWAESGNRVAFRVEVSSIESQWFAGALVRDETGAIILRNEPLPAGIDNVAFDAVGDSVLYTFSNENGAGGYIRNLKTGVEELLWSTPFSTLAVLWGEKTYVYPKPTALWNGYLYHIEEGGSLVRVGQGAKGLTAESSPTHILITSATEGSLTSTVLNTDTNEESAIAIAGLPEKCAFGKTSSAKLWCAAPFEYSQAEYPDAWYRGDVVLSDFLWEVNTQNGEAALLADFEEEVFRVVDTAHMSVSSDEKYALIQNKIDNTLWLVDLTL